VTDPTTTDRAGPEGGDPARPGLRGTVIATRDGFTLDVALDVAPGETLAVVGPNGSGKSTLIAALGGLMPLADGQLSFGDRLLDHPASDVFVPAEARGFALVPQDGLLFPHLSLLANVAFGLRHRDPRGESLSRASRDERARAALAAVDLADLEARRPSELSGGQVQRAAVARALVVEAPVLLLDEPLSNIDADNRQMIRKLLGSERPAGQIQVVVTHGGDHAADADRLLAIENGRLLATGSPQDLAADPPTRWLAELLW
jgi:molybdate transport system ATP-binding protein